MSLRATRRNRTVPFPIAEGNGLTYRVQKLARETPAGRIWATVNVGRPAVAERILLLRRTDGEFVRLVQR